MRCLVCGSNRILLKPTKISDFLVAKIFGEDEVVKNYNVNLCHCEECSFSFYDRRLTDEESSRLYDGYRGMKYQKIREKYDCWYTEKINNAMNHDSMALKEQQRVIKKMIKENIPTNIKAALDYGGNQGETLTELIGTDEKYVYDISGVDTKGGVKGIKDYDELYKYNFDFIMCNMTLEHVSYPKEFIKLLYDIGSAETYYYVEVPSENPFKKDKFSVIKNLQLLFNPHYNNIKLVKHYLHLKGQPYMPMSEHINFWTPKALKTLMLCSGFDVIDIQENYEKGVLGKNKVLSVICKKTGTFH